MAKKLKADRPYTLEMTGDDKVTMHFDMQRSPGGAPERWMILGILMVLGGFFPGAIVGMAAGGGEDINGFMFCVGWIGSIVLPFIMANRAYKRQGRRGSKYTRMIFTRNDLETTSKTVLDRADIEGSWWRGADTSFTYRDRTSYNINKAVADSKAEKGNAVGVTYGSQDVKITHHTLNKNQAQKIADAVARWLDDPQRLFDEAKGVQEQADAA